MSRLAPRSLRCIDVQSWRACIKEEVIAHLENAGAGIKKRGKKSPKNGSILAVRQHLSPVDVYCYLKARFGEPNGIQNLIRKDDSDNLIHWDFMLKAGDEDVYICGMSREIHFMLSENLTDEDWRDLILKIKDDYQRVGKEKSAILKSLEKWVVFPNKFVEIAKICEDLHAEIVDNRGGFQTYKTSSTNSKKVAREKRKTLDHLNQRSSKLYKSCLELSVITPILAEAFINMVILMLCKKEIRNNGRQLETFIRSHIDTKIFDLFYKCEGFARPIDPESDTYKNFKRVMDKRNNTIHGNVDPEKEKIETVYFESTRPLFIESGDHIGKFFEALEHQYQPEKVIKDYEDTYTFLLEIVACLKPGMAKNFWAIMEDNYPGYDVDRQILGCILPEHVVVGGALGVRYDDELAVWK